MVEIFYRFLFGAHVGSTLGRHLQRLCIAEWLFRLVQTFNLGLFLVHLLEFSWFVSLIGTFRGIAGEVSFTNVSARDINISFYVSPNVTSAIAGDGLCSA